jgi:TolA-binding protein
VELPDGMYLLGLAQLQMAKGEKGAAKRKPLLVRAGLNLMRVVVFHGGSEAAAPALLAAGEVNELLGNKAGARKAYMLVLTKYGKSSVAAEAKKRVLALSEKIGE